MKSTEGGGRVGLQHKVSVTPKSTVLSVQKIRVGGA